METWQWMQGKRGEMRTLVETRWPQYLEVVDRRHGRGPSSLADAYFCVHPSVPEQEVAPGHYLRWSSGGDTPARGGTVRSVVEESANPLDAADCERGPAIVLTLSFVPRAGITARPFTKRIWLRDLESGQMVLLRRWTPRELEHEELLRQLVVATESVPSPSPPQP